MVHVAHYHDHRRAGQQVLRFVLEQFLKVSAKEMLDVGRFFFALDGQAELRRHDGCGLKVDRLVDRRHYAVAHERRHHLRQLDAGLFRQFLDGELGRKQYRAFLTLDLLLHNRRRGAAG